MTGTVVSARRGGDRQNLFRHFQTVMVPLKEAGEIGVGKQPVLLDHRAAGDPRFAQFGLALGREQGADIK